jgi:hypothetical protein
VRDERDDPRDLAGDTATDAAGEPAELADRLPDDLDPHAMADSLQDELIAEEGEAFGLDPDLAVFAAREELDETGEDDGSAFA